MQAEERGGGAGEEDAGLVDGGVDWIERAVVREGCGRKGEEKRGRHALVDGVFCDVDEEEGKHAVVGKKRVSWVLAPATGFRSIKDVLRDEEMTHLLEVAA